MGVVINTDIGILAEYAYYAYQGDQTSSYAKLSDTEKLRWIGIVWSVLAMNANPPE